MPEFKLKLYPRGFLGSILEGRLQRKVGRVEDNFGFRTSIQQIFNAHQDVNDFNEDIENLYQDLAREAVGVGTFEFEERALTAALKAFGTDNFYLWFEAQYKNSAAGDYHGKFLADTIKFIETGRRDVNLSSWNWLIVPSTDGTKISPASIETKQFFGFNEYGERRHRRNDDLVRVIQDWCSQPDGLEDMLTSLHLMFGKSVD